jgi:carbon-monoxide dehydrogenase medium subunit
MIPPAFDYHAPKTLSDAVGLLAQLGPEAKLLAGGHSLLPMMKLRFAHPAHLIDRNRIDELRGVCEQGYAPTTSNHDGLNIFFEKTSTLNARGTP